MGHVSDDEEDPLESLGEEVQQRRPQSGRRAAGEAAGVLWGAFGMGIVL